MIFTSERKTRGNVLLMAAGIAAAVAGLSGCAGPTPTALLSDDDVLLRNRVRAEALEHNKTGEASNWSGPATGRRGSIVPTRTYKSDDGADCREFQETITAADDTDILYGAACRTDRGVWVVFRGPYRHRQYDEGYYDPYWRYGYRYGHFGYWSRPFP